MRVVPQTHAAARTALAHSPHDRRGRARLVARQPVHRPRRPRALDRQLRLGPLRRHARLPAPGAGARHHRLLRALEQARHSGFSGLPTGLRDDDATSADGLGIVVYGASAAAAEARLLAHPATLELSTSSTAEGIEDRVIPTPVAARRLEEMSRLGRYVAAVELYVAAQAVDLRDRSGELGEGTRRVYALVRAHAPRPLPGEPPLADLSPLEQALQSGSDPERRP